jgi:hypothetical protein
MPCPPLSPRLSPWKVRRDDRGPCDRPPERAIQRLRPNAPDRIRTCDLRFRSRGSEAYIWLYRAKSCRTSRQKVAKKSISRHFWAWRPHAATLARNPRAGASSAGGQTTASRPLRACRARRTRRPLSCGASVFRSVTCRSRARHEQSAWPLGDGLHRRRTERVHRCCSVTRVEANYAIAQACAPRRCLGPSVERHHRALGSICRRAAHGPSDAYGASTQRSGVLRRELDIRAAITGGVR